MPREVEVWLPNGLDFSPNREGLLPGVLEICANLEGDSAAIKEQIAQKFYWNTTHPEASAGNCWSGMKSYGLVDDGVLTEIGRDLLLVDDRDEQAKRFAYHLLLRCLGVYVIDAIEIIESSGGWNQEKKVQVAEVLEREFGIKTAGGGNGKSVSTMKKWLEKAGLITGNSWTLNRDAINSLLGAKRGVIDSMRDLRYEEQCFLKTLLNLYIEGNSFVSEDRDLINSNLVRSRTEEQFGIRLSITNLPQVTLAPLQEKGLIEVDYPGRSEAHGGARYYVKPNQGLLDEELGSFVNRLGEGRLVDERIKQGLRMSYSDAVAMCEAEDAYTKGVGLEILSLKILKSAGLEPVGMRVRDQGVAGAEVDLVFYDERGTHSVWQVQCKNTQTVSSDRVFREIGMAFVSRKNVVCIIATGSFAQGAIDAARIANMNTAMHVVLISKEDIDRLVNGDITALKLIEGKMADIRCQKDRAQRISYTSIAFWGDE